MKEGFYWIQFNGDVQIARYVDQVAENLETGESVIGAWELVGFQPNMINSSDVEVLSGQLLPPK